MHNQTFWKEFLELYKSLPALWRVKSKCYTDRALKAKSYEKLVKKLREIDPDATRATAVRKINNFRTNYRRQFRRIQKSSQAVLKGEVDPNKIYRTSLWYYDQLSFLDEYTKQDDDEVLQDDMSEEEEIEISMGQEKFDPESEMEELDFVDFDKSDNITETEHLQFNETSISLPSTEPPAKKKKHGTEKIHQTHRLSEVSTNLQPLASANPIRSPISADSLLQTSAGTQQLKENNNESTLLSHTWANQFSELDNRQKVIARKLISDVLFYGCTKQLNLHTRIDNLTNIEDDNYSDAG